MPLQNKSVLEIVEASLEAAEANDKLNSGPQAALPFGDLDAIDLESLLQESDEDSDAQIKAHNDALDGKTTPEITSDSDGHTAEPETDVEIPEPEGPSEAELINELFSQKFLGYNNARALLGSGDTLAGRLDELRKPLMRNERERTALDEAMDAAPGADNENKQGQGEQVSMSAGAAALMMGSAGLAKLGSVIGTSLGLVGQGCGLVGQEIGRQIDSRHSKQLKSSIVGLDTQMDMLRSQGLGQLDDKGMTLAERQNLAKQYFSQPGNKQQLEQLFEQADRLKQQARLMIEKGLKKGDSPDAVMDRVLEPLRRFTEQNEPFLESLKMGNETLLEKMDGAMNSLFDIIKRTFQRLAGALGIGAGAEDSPKANANSAPRQG